MTTTDTLKSEVDSLLKGYGIPYEDRTLVLEKIDASVDTLVMEERERFEQEIGKIRDEIASEREGIRQELDGIRQSALSSIQDMNGKNDEAYETGLAEGIEMGSKGQLGTMQVIIGLGLLALAMVWVAGTIFKKD